ncbi:uncharacterized protein LOC106021624 isoform X2 [Mesocricetus auratus]|uniref:Uncharacterized protein LOC106021624 isoform X2 n=1 Tax=Mesocricetus auratus TaxID=10036 RepID=A0ABM2WVJ2_MESAU|nr:uncharacterized protein LOC106021624 isoform X2 [Mesocricetus auratus]
MNEGWMGEKAGARWHKVRGQPGRVAGTSERRSRSDLRDPGSLWGRRHRCKAAVQPWLRVAGSGLRRFGLGRGSVETSPGLRAWERLQHRWDEAVLSGLQGRAPRRPQPAGSAARRPCSLRFPRSCRTQVPGGLTLSFHLLGSPHTPRRCLRPRSDPEEPRWWVRRYSGGPAFGTGRTTTSSGGPV